jgi:hypothetical protein
MDGKNLHTLYIHFYFIFERSCSYRFNKSILNITWFLGAMHPIYNFPLMALIPTGDFYRIFVL